MGHTDVDDPDPPTPIPMLPPSNSPQPIPELDIPALADLPAMASTNRKALVFLPAHLVYPFAMQNLIRVSVLLLSVSFTT